jgi:hypothetical protein
MTLEAPGFARAGDHHKYVYMADRGPLDFHVAPFCWRPGLPALVRLLPFGSQRGFFLVTCLALGASGVAMYYLARAAGKDVTLSWAGMLIFFGSGWATKYPLFNFWLPDPVVLLLVVWLMRLVLLRREAAFAALLAAAIFVKESAAFAAPLWLTWGDLRLAWPRRLVRGIAVMLPAAGLFILLRATIVAKNVERDYVGSLPARLTEVDEGRTSYDYGEQFRRISWQRLGDVSARTLESVHSYSVGSFGVLPVVLPFLALGLNFRVLVRLSPLLILVYAQLFLATDTQRLLVMALPALTLMALNGLEALGRGWRLRPVEVLALPACIVALNAWKCGRMAGPSWAEACILLAWLVTMLVLRAWRERRA